MMSQERKELRPRRAKLVRLDMPDDEAKVLDECVSRRMYSLEEAGLTDSYCYPKLSAVRQRLRRAMPED